MLLSYALWGLRHSDMKRGDPSVFVHRLTEQAMPFFTLLLVLNALNVVADSQCVTSRIAKFTVLKFNLSTRSTVLWSNGCFGNANKTYLFSLNTSKTVERVDVESGNPLSTGILYSYSGDQWFEYVGTATKSSLSVVTFNPPIFLKQLVISFGPVENGEKCLSAILHACSEDIAPAVSFQSAAGSVLYESINTECNIKGQPYPSITWRTTDGFVFANGYIENRFSKTSTSHSSTLTVAKEALANDGFRCGERPPPCMRLVCIARYPGSNKSSSVERSIDVFPSSPENFRLETAFPKSVIAIWDKPVRDSIMNYTRFGIALTSNQGPRRDNIQANYRSAKYFRHVITNLVPCTYYALEISSVNYQGESIWAKSNFTTTAGLIAITSGVHNVTADSVVTSWLVKEQFGSNCRINNATVFLIEYLCLKGLSNLDSCRHRQQRNATNDARSLVVENLNPATEYQIYITALTSQADFNVSSEVMLFRTGNALPTAAPSDFKVKAVNTSSITVSWNEIEKEKRNGDIMHYKLLVYNSSALIMSEKLSVTRVNGTVITGLQECTEYSLQVAGCNSEGCGPLANASVRTADLEIEASFSIDVTLNENNPRNIFAVVVALVGSASLESCITGYVLQFKEMDAVNWTTAEKLSLNQTSATIYALKPVSTYVFRAKLVGYSRSGNWTPLVEIKTAEGIPSAIRNIRLTELSPFGAVVSWVSPLESNGAISYFKMEVNGRRSYNASFYQSINTNVTDRTHEVLSRLLPATLYNISIYARNRKYIGPASSITYQTEALPPLQPDPVVLDEATSIFSSVKVTAAAVPAVYGPVTAYQVVVELQEGNSKVLNFSKAVPKYEEARLRNLSFYETRRLKPFVGASDFYIGDGRVDSGLTNAPLNQRQNYTIYIRAVTDWNSNTLYSLPSATHLWRYPLNTEPVLAEDERTASSITIKLVKMHGNVQYMRIIVQRIDLQRAAELPQPDFYYESNITLYAASKERQFMVPYVAAELGKNYFEAVDRFVIGDGKLTNRSSTRKRRSISEQNITSFFNGPLDPGSSYVVFFRAYHKGGVYFSSTWSDPITTEQLTPAAKVQVSTSVGLIMGITICAIAVPFFIIFGYVLWKRNRKAFDSNYQLSTMELVGNGKKSRMISFFDDHFDAEDSIGSSTATPPYDLKYEVDAAHQPILISDFSGYYDAMKEKDYAFEDEFIELRESSSKERLASTGNIALNKDKEAVALDSARVVLEREKKGASNYINAAFVDSYNAQNAYIATQSPMKGMIKDFWDMILQQNVRTIVMLTHVLDEDRLASPDYWPTSVKLIFGDGDVVVESKDNVFDDCAVVRGFLLSGKKKQPRTVRHFQFNKWPKRGIPISTKDLLMFRDLVNQWHKGKSSPQVVHCSKGSGRTGTYIALDAIFNNIGLSKTVDVFNYVNYLRTRRTNMVATERQYEFIYEVINDLLNKVDRNTELTKRNAKELFSSLSTVDPLTGHNGFQKLFKNISQGLETASSLVKKLEGSQAINEYKNRYSFKVPHDSFRVRLPVGGSGKSSPSDYINATFVSLSHSSRFITTQAPFGITVNDFWSMVHFSRAEVIVSLNDLQEDSVVFPPYWPESEVNAAIYGNFKVTLELETTPFPCVIQRDFTLSEVSHPNETVEVTQFHLLGWRDHDVPSSRIAVLHLCRHLSSEWMSEEVPPLIVQCSDGFGRSGTFCVCLETIKRLTRDGITDIPNIARKLKEKNKYFIENETQFRFIFDIALDLVCRQ